MKIEQEPRGGSNFLEKKFSRRSFLKGATYGVAGVVASAAVGCESFDDDIKPIPSVTMPKELPTPRLLEDEPGELVKVSGVVVQLSRGGLPIYSIGLDGVRDDFNLDKMRALRDQAKSLAEPEIVKMLPIEVGRTKQLPVEGVQDEHPFNHELPEDTLSETQLARRGIEIIQAEVSQLYIREGAFDQGALLSGFVDGSRKLKIVLMDSNVVSRHFLDASKYDDVRDRAPSYGRVDVLKSRAARIDTNSQRLSEVREVPGLTREAKLADIENLLYLKTEVYWVNNMLTDREITETSVISEQLRLRGMYFKGVYMEAVGDKPAVIFLAVGESEAPDYARIYFDGNGKTVVDEMQHFSAFSNTLPHARQSYPDAEKIGTRWNYKWNLKYNPDSYIFDFDTAGEFLRHEVGHDYQMGYLGRSGNESEADLKAYESIATAHQKWILSGDNSGYYFVFSGNDENGDSGYILTTAEVPDKRPDLA